MKTSEQVGKVIVEHGKRELPHEAGDYLAQRDGLVVGSYPLTNQAKGVAKKGGIEDVEDCLLAVS